MYASNCGIQLIYAEMLYFLKSFPQVQNQQNLPYAFIVFGQGDLYKVLICTLQFYCQLYLFVTEQLNKSC